jgi:hypothetical protein
MSPGAVGDRRAWPIAQLNPGASACGEPSAVEAAHWHYWGAPHIAQSKSVVFSASVKVT